MDFGDEALCLREVQVAVALAHAARKPPGAGEEPDWKDGKPHCAECGRAFPLERYQAIKGGTSLCVQCADEGASFVMR